MKTLTEYVQSEFYELPRTDWDRKMVIDFIQVAANRDESVYDEIIDVYVDNLIGMIASFDLSYSQKYTRDIQEVMLANARCAIDDIIEDIQYEFDQEETDSQLRSDFERVEGAAINRDRR